MILTNAVFISICIVLAMCVYRINVVIALTTGAIVCGLIDGHTLNETINTFLFGLQNGVTIAFNYALLGAFASATAYSGLTTVFASWVSGVVRKHGDGKKKRFLIKAAFCLMILFMSIACKNIIPVHIAYIPILIPPLLVVFNDLQIDRRMLACIITFGVITAYMTIPIGFGEIFIANIMQHYLTDNGLNVSVAEIVRALLVPAGGMSIGLLFAIFNYRKNRAYKRIDAEFKTEDNNHVSKKAVIVSLLAIAGALCTQLLTHSTMLGALIGFLVFTFGGVIHWKDADGVVVKGFKMMAQISFIMLTAAGFAHVVKTSGDISSLIDFITNNVGSSKLLAATCMLGVGFLISVGIGSSFSTVPIIAGIYVPLCAKLGFSPTATIIIIATCGVMGDAGSPASDSTLGPTSGLNADGQHNHMQDSVIPAFMHLSIPVFITSLIASVLM